MALSRESILSPGFNSGILIFRDHRLIRNILGHEIKNFECKIEQLILHASDNRLMFKLNLKLFDKN